MRKKRDFSEFPVFLVVFFSLIFFVYSYVFVFAFLSTRLLRSAVIPMRSLLSLVVLLLHTPLYAQNPTDPAPAPAPAPTPAPPTSPTQKPAFVVAARTEPAKVNFGQRFFVVVEITRDKGTPIDIPASLPESDAVRRSGNIERSVENNKNTDNNSANQNDGNKVKEIIRIPYLLLGIDGTETPAFALRAPNGDAIDVPALPISVADSVLDSQDPSNATTNPNPNTNPNTNPNSPHTDQGDELTLLPAQKSFFFTIPDVRPAATVLAFAGSIAGLWLLRRAQAKRKLFVPAPTQQNIPVVVKSPYERALEKLDALLAEQLLENGEVPVFVSRLMDEVLRFYLVERYQVPADKRTTRELADDLFRMPDINLDVPLIRQLLEDADLVKFARADMQAETARDMAQRVRMLISATALDQSVTTSKAAPLPLASMTSTQRGPR